MRIRDFRYLPITAFIGSLAGWATPALAQCAVGSVPGPTAYTCNDGVYVGTLVDTDGDNSLVFSPGGTGIIDGGVLFGNGNDTISISSGTITGNVQQGSGIDRFRMEAGIIQSLNQGDNRDIFFMSGGRIIDAFAETIGRGRQPEQPQARILRFQVGDDLLVLAGIVVGNPVAFIDNQQGKLAAERRQIGGDGLHATKHHFAAALFKIQPGGKDVRLQTVGKIFAVILRDQFFDVRQHQHAATRHAGQFGNHQTFSGACGQHNHRRFIVLTEMTQRGIHGILLIGAECKSSHGLPVTFWFFPVNNHSGEVCQEIRRMAMSNQITPRECVACLFLCFPPRMRR